MLFILNFGKAIYSHNFNSVCNQLSVKFLMGSYCNILYHYAQSCILLIIAQVESNSSAKHYNLQRDGFNPNCWPENAVIVATLERVRVNKQL